MSDTATKSPTTPTTTKEPWTKEQNWIKDVLSKSGTELVQLTLNKAVKITKKLVKDEEKGKKF